MFGGICDCCGTTTFFSNIRGRGIERIFDACREAGTPAPVIRHETTGLWVEFSFPKNSVEAGSTTQETSQEKIFAFMRGTPSITHRELAQKIDLTEDGIKYHLQKLKLAGIVEHMGPTKAVYWNILK